VLAPGGARGHADAPAFSSSCWCGPTLSPGHEEGCGGGVLLRLGKPGVCSMAPCSACGPGCAWPDGALPLPAPVRPGRWPVSRDEESGGAVPCGPGEARAEGSLRSPWELLRGRGDNRGHQLVSGLCFVFSQPIYIRHSWCFFPSYTDVSCPRYLPSSLSKPCRFPCVCPGRCAASPPWAESTLLRGGTSRWYAPSSSLAQPSRPLPPSPAFPWTETAYAAQAVRTRSLFCQGDLFNHLIFWWPFIPRFHGYSPIKRRSNKAASQTGNKNIKAMCALGGREGEQHSVRRDRPCQGDRRVARNLCVVLAAPGSVPSLCRGLTADAASDSILPRSLGACCRAGQRRCHPCAALTVAVLPAQSCEWPNALEIRAFLQLYFISGL